MVSKVSCNSGSGKFVPKFFQWPGRYSRQSACASSYFPAKKSSRISCRCDRAPGFTSSVAGAPDHAVNSDSAIRSTVVPPKTIPPKRPFPMGRASSHRSAGFVYQSSSLFMPDCARSEATNCGTTAVARPPRKKLRRSVIKAFLSDEHTNVTATLRGRNRSRCGSRHTKVTHSRIVTLLSEAFVPSRHDGWSNYDPVQVGRVSRCIADIDGVDSGLQLDREYDWHGIIEGGPIQVEFLGCGPVYAQEIRAGSAGLIVDLKLIGPGRGDRHI